MFFGVNANGEQVLYVYINKNETKFSEEFILEFKFLYYKLCGIRW